MDDLEAQKRRQDGLADPGDEAGSGWIACTTDSILAMKDTLWDMLITMPPNNTTHASPSFSSSSSSSSSSPTHLHGIHPDKAWPTVEFPRGTPVKATQRDFRRFNALRNGLLRLAAHTSDPEPDSPRSETSAVRPSTSRSHRIFDDERDETSDALIEPITWTALAYNGYMWWASAGEQLRSEQQEEAFRDAALLADLAPSPQHSPISLPRSSSRELVSESLSSLAARHGGTPEARTELAIIAYFHRLTTQMLSVLSDLVDSADEAYPSLYRDEEDDAESGGEDEGEDEDEALLRNGSDDRFEDRAITVDSRALETMGLDVWSATDGSFVQDLMGVYFGRGARIEGKGVEICGVRVC